MGARSSRRKSQNNRSDGHLLEYFRNTFVRGGGGTNAPPPPTATGGTIVYNMDIQKNVHIFTSSQTFIPLYPSPFTADYFVVAGGGGGSSGAGGAGGLRRGTFTATSGLSYTVTIGAGAPGGRVSGSVSSIVTGPTIVVQSSGGGGGGIGVPGTPSTAPPDINALPGGSGGGGGFRNPPLDNAGAGGSGNAGGYTPVEGFPGSPGGGSPPAWGGGGGGAGGAASPGSSGSPGAGGVGISTNIAPPSYGTPGPTPGRWFGGGGGNGGGFGGGGPGTGDTNTGGGGAPGSAGGSGIVLIAYTIP